MVITLMIEQKQHHTGCGGSYEVLASHPSLDRLFPPHIMILFVIVAAAAAVVVT